MFSLLFRPMALLALLGGMLIAPATTSADQSQPGVVLITLTDGAACRGPITGTTFNLVDQRATYACTDGRWILGEPFTLPDGRQIAMLGRTILQGQRASDSSDPCLQPTCLVGLQQAEVSTTATLQRVVRVAGYNGNDATCNFVDGDTFYLGTSRANYRCDVPKEAHMMSNYPPEAEMWVLGAPFTQYVNNSVPEPHAYAAIIVRQGTKLVPGNDTYPACSSAICVMNAFTALLSQ
jgi:hypothetical protein